MILPVAGGRVNVAKEEIGKCVCLGAGISVAGVLALNLSRHDRNRADLS